jgi:hypothetical protein
MSVISVAVVYCVNCKALFLKDPLDCRPTLAGDKDYVPRPNRQCPACHRFAETRAVDLYMLTGDGDQGYGHEAVRAEVYEPFGE